ncbi:Glutamine-rich protein 2, partial [Pteropus alecto]
SSASEFLFQKLLQRIEGIERNIQDREESLKLMTRKLSLVPAGEDVTMVTWEELEQAITDGWKTSQAENLPSVTATSAITRFGSSSSEETADQLFSSRRLLDAKPPLLERWPLLRMYGSPRCVVVSGFSGFPKALGVVLFVTLSENNSPVQPGLVQPRMAQRGLVQPGTGQPGLVQPGMAPRGLVQPGAVQPGLVQPGVDQHGLVQPGIGQPGLVQPGVGQRGLVQPGTGQPGLVQPGVDQRGLVQPGTGQPGLVQPGVDQLGLVQPGISQRSLVQPNAGQRDLVQPGEVHPGGVQPVMDQSGLVQPGIDQRDLVQPSVYQRGLVQPDTSQLDFVQSGMDQRGLLQPGTDPRGFVQPGFVQPGMYPHSLVQPSAYSRGLVQPGAYPRGLVQPGAYPRGLVQPGAYPPGLVQPGVYPPGLVQPGAYPRGLVLPGAYPRGLVRPGAYTHDFMKPGTDRRGLRHPGADQRGSAPSGTELHGFPTSHQDSASFLSPRPYQQGPVPPGRDQHGQVSPLLATQGPTSPGIDQEGLVPTETYRQGLMPPGTDQHGSTPLSTDVGSAGPDQEHLVSPSPQQRDQVQPSAGQRDRARSVPDSRGLVYPGPRGPGYQGVDQHVQVGLGPKQLGISIQTPASQDATFATSADDVDRDSLEKSDFQRERKDSLDRVAPSFPIAVETFRLMGELIGLYVELKDKMKELDEEKSGQTDLEKIQFLLSLMIQKTIPPDLLEQLKTLKTLTKEIQREKAKMQKILDNEKHLELGKETKASQLGLQLGILRVTVADIEKELAELRDSQERGKISMEHSVSEASIYLQDQLDKLRTIIESMLASSSTLLSMSMAPEKTLMTLTPGQIDPQATCPACSLDVSHQVSTLVQRYEQLQDMVNNLAASRPSKKAKLQSQDEELLGHVQSAILQVQGDCEKLNITTSNLIEDHRQKQKDIDVLYQGLQKLEKEKANREHLEMEIDVKADKSALAAKVSRVQFDATTEQLNHMMQELVAKMSGQEQDWQKILDRLLTEMDNKADEAAAMRRVLPVTPVGPCLPGHRSSRPYTIFELEQVRQQSRNLKLGGPAGPRGDLALMERSVGRLRTMHSKMLMDIEKVQIHFGGSVKASSQMIRELLQAQCLSSPCYKRVPDMADYTYSTVPRRCGGSHTLTYPYRRTRLQHLPQGLYPSEEIQIAMKHDEVDILGLDGHIYKGRMDTRLPGIPNRDNSGVSKHKVKPPRSHAHRQQSLGDSSQLPSRPQSAQMLAGNTSAPSRQRTDRPVSSEGRLSQPNVAHLPSASEMAAGLEMPMDVPPGEGLEEPTRGPRSTTAH